MFDCHAHIGKSTSMALVATASTDEAEALLSFPYRSLGALPGHPSSLDKLEVWAKENHIIGEVGIDRRYPDKEKQISFFRSVLDIASYYQSLVVIHQVGWTNDLLSILNDYPTLSFMVHGFTGSLETAKLVVRRGGFLSLSPRAEKTSSFSSILTSGLPFLTETDMESGEEEEKTIREWTEKLSRLSLRNIEEEVDSWAREFVFPYRYK